MYKKQAQGWLKHWDFIFMDVICLQLAFIAAYFFRHGFTNPYSNPLYRNEAIALIFCQIAVAFFTQSFSNILKRGFYEEFTKSAKHVIIVMLLANGYLFLTQDASSYSRITFVITAIEYLILCYATRVLWKKYLISHGHGKSAKRSIVVVTVSDMAERVIQHIYSEPYQDFVITGLIFLDKDMTGETVNDVPVVAGEGTMVDNIRYEWVDEIFICVPSETPYPDKLIDKCIEMGLTVHLSLAKIENISGSKQHIEKIGEYTVLTTSINMASPKQLLYKRTLDVLGGLTGCLITAVLVIIIGPLIYIKSPGPIFFSQIRIGMNGKKFKIYKFRSMYMDAEERKKDLMEQNKMKDGFMFKLDYDPRIIGSEKKDRNGNPKGIGNFIRKTSIDEFPQFWNVLKGDMSLVGTRPPTVDEWEKYDLHHRGRMAFKPGITGMWQVSGRSDITDFEEVVRLDMEYIRNWSIGLDIKILFKTVLSVLKNDGAV
ncbi:MAG: sugar transferase [Eubacteriales bacterium]|nr:sugar transferase [Eubacteriales bacterium]